MPTRTIRLLVVEDYLPFRRLVCSTLKARPDYRVVGEASDGLEAVQKAAELQPDVVVLDIGLPTQSGVTAARHILRLCPRTKIVFLSQQSDAVVIEEAFRAGGHAYVVKTHAPSELLIAVEAVCGGTTFVTKGVSGRQVMLPGTHEASARSHEAHFYPDHESCAAAFASFVEDALNAGKAVIVVATESHRRTIAVTLREHGVDVDAATRSGRYIPVDATDTLASFMVGDHIDANRFQKGASDLLAAAARAVMGDWSRVAACGEGVSMLWAAGKTDAVVRLEQLWDEMARAHGMEILCGYVMQGLEHEQQDLYDRICTAHSAIY